MPSSKLSEESKKRHEYSELINRLDYYHKMHKIPLGSDLAHVLPAVGYSAKVLREIIGIEAPKTLKPKRDLESKGVIEPAFRTKLGTMYRGDCLSVLKTLKSESVDLIFADPPFNLNKSYASKINDKLDGRDYISWCKSWAIECARVLKFGGSMFVWNLPKWNLALGSFLTDYLTLRHWIAVDIKYHLPIAGRLYPSHSSLIYLCKGSRPKTFHPDRLPMEVCRDCKTELKDYGGYKDRMNPKGINLTDVWYDISPVRHRKYKKRVESNELPLKLLDRIVQLASNEGDIVLDPFGGSGTTYVASELTKRKWIGIELGPIAGIKSRFLNIHEDRQHLAKIRKNVNSLFTEETLKIRKRKGFWTPESVRRAK